MTEKKIKKSNFDATKNKNIIVKSQQLI